MRYLLLRTDIIMLYKLGTSKSNLLDLDFGEGENSDSPENYILANAITHKYDWLIFLDSRGNQISSQSKDNFITFPERISNQSINQSILFVSRPKYLTCFFSLINFLHKNEIKFKNLLTNVGFVDTTPKKNQTILDILCQASAVGVSLEKKFLCTWKLGNGEKTSLNTCYYDDICINYICDVIKTFFFHSYFLTTPVISEHKISLCRKRPYSFFMQLQEANTLIKKIALGTEGSIIDISYHGINTYDGVHYTENDHNLIFEILDSKLKGMLVG